MSKYKDAYFAGLIDGEGCLHLEKVKTKSGHRLRGTIEVNMTCRDTIDALQSYFGGYIFYRPAQKLGWKNQWRWRIRDARAKAALEKLMPHLLTKKSAALLLLEHWEKKGAA